MTEIDELGKNIITLRRALHLSQEKTASRSLLSANYFRNIENGQANATMETFRRIAKTLKVAPATLGIISWTDEDILALLHRFPGLPEYSGKPLDMFQNIVLLRKTYGLTQRQLARLSEVSVATIRNLEHGFANISTSTLTQIANALNVSPLKLAVLTTPEEEFIATVHEARRTAGLANEAYPAPEDTVVQAKPATAV